MSRCILIFKEEKNILYLLLRLFNKARNGIVTVLLFLGYLWYDGVCYVISNRYGYLRALGIMSIFLFALSVLLVFVHELANKYFSWDILGLQHINELRNNNQLPKHKLFKRFMRWVMTNGYWTIYLVGPWTVGPFIVALLLRKEEKWKENMLYIIPGTLISVIFWVTVWTGVGVLTWKQFVVPLYNKIM